MRIYDTIFLLVCLSGACGNQAFVPDGTSQLTNVVELRPHQDITGWSVDFEVTSDVSAFQFCAVADQVDMAVALQEREGTRVTVLGRATGNTLSCLVPEHGALQDIEMHPGFSYRLVVFGELREAPRVSLATAEQNLVLLL